MRPPVPATAFFKAGILLFCAIEPVLSSTSATRILTLPQVVVDEGLKPSVGKPIMFMKSVVIEPDPVIWIVAAVVDVAGV